MIKSMTAFAHIENKNEFGALTWEVRSVNHRYLDVNTRLPEDLRGLEQAVREKVASQLKRGKVDCILRYKANVAAAGEIVLDTEYARTVIGACDKINRLLTQGEAIRATEILRWPGVMKEVEKDLTPVQTVALAKLDEALVELIANREREGASIQELLQQRCTSIDEIIKQVRARMPEVLKNVRTKIETKLADLLAKVDQDRLEQELVMIAQRMDVEEELDRLETHIKEVHNVLAGEGSVGRRLDFLMQELNREANTLGSKSADSLTTQASVDLKVCIEQMREQVQNVE